MKPMRRVEVPGPGDRSVVFGAACPLAWILGPCVIEDQRTMAAAAERIRWLGDKLEVPVVFKSSFEKDNRSSEEYYSGPGLDEGLEMLAWIRKEFELPILSDVHSVEHVYAAREVLDVIQIPAFLCQQTSLLVAAGSTGKVINVKKGQFLSPEGMASPVGKLERTGNHNLLLTERGAQFGYNTLVADMTALPTMRALGYPVVFDAGHQVRRYGIPSADPRGGSREQIPTLLRAAVAAGANGIFLETHPDPASARCDAASQFSLDRLEQLMTDAQELGALIRTQGYA